jgi:hypothetical protein
MSIQSAPTKLTLNMAAGVTCCQCSTMNVFYFYFSAWFFDLSSTNQFQELVHELMNAHNLYASMKLL